MEIWYSGSHGMTPSQYEAALRVSAAIFDFHGWGAKSAIAHGEWQPGKWDPGYAPGKMMDMRAVRSDIARKLAGGNVSEPVPGKERTSVVWGRSGSVRVDLGVRRDFKKKKNR